MINILQYRGIDGLPAPVLAAKLKMKYFITELSIRHVSEVSDIIIIGVGMSKFVGRG